MAEGTVGHFQEFSGLTSHSAGSLKSGLQVLFFHLGDLAFKVEAFGRNLNFLRAARGNSGYRFGEIGQLDDSVALHR